MPFLRRFLRCVVPLEAADVSTGGPSDAAVSVHHKRIDLVMLQAFWQGRLIPGARIESLPFVEAIRNNRSAAVRDSIPAEACSIYLLRGARSIVAYQAISLAHVGPTCVTIDNGAQVFRRLRGTLFFGAGFAVTKNKLTFCDALDQTLAGAEPGALSERHHITIAVDISVFHHTCSLSDAAVRCMQQSTSSSKLEGLSPGQTHDRTGSHHHIIIASTSARRCSAAQASHA